MGQAVKSLHERYHCLSVDDNKYQGNQDLTRAEFAQMLNSCLQKISDIKDDHLIKKDDLIVIPKLPSDFNTKLTKLPEHLKGMLQIVGVLAIGEAFGVG